MAQTEQPTSPESPTQPPDVERKAPVVQLVAIGVVASILGTVLGILIDWFPTRASTQLETIETVYDVLIAASVPMFVLVMAVVFYCVWKFRMKPGEEDKDGPPIHGNTRIEVIWTTIPALLMLLLCTYAYIELRNIEEAPANPAEELNVRVVGEQFTWTFFYPPEQEGGDETASAQLYLPINRSVRFTVQAKDVLHDFWVPSFGMKIDAVPGIDTHFRVTPNRLGTYDVVCAELCGLGHAVMRQSAHVVTPEAFEKWLADERKPAEGGEVQAGAEETKPGDIDGKDLFTTVEPKCGACHTLADAETAGGIGPNLDDSLKGKDADYIRRAIEDPEADIAEGFSGGIMPPYKDTLDPAEIDALVDYLVKATSG